MQHHPTAGGSRQLPTDTTRVGAYQVDVHDGRVTISALGHPAPAVAVPPDQAIELAAAILGAAVAIDPAALGVDPTQDEHWMTVA